MYDGRREDVRGYREELSNSWEAGTASLCWWGRLWYLDTGLVGLEGMRIGGNRTSNRVFSAIILWNPIPTPSITASRQAHPIAEFLAALYPPRTASAPPVKNPAITTQILAMCPYSIASVPIPGTEYVLALYGSSFFLIPLTAQSNVENSPPQTPKLPPSTGARALIAVNAPIRLSP